jgi:hypothetical protein
MGHSLQMIGPHTGTVQAGVSTWARLVRVVAPMIKFPSLRNTLTGEKEGDAVRAHDLTLIGTTPIPVGLGASPQPAVSRLVHPRPEPFGHIRGVVHFSPLRCSTFRTPSSDILASAAMSFSSSPDWRISAITSSRSSMPSAAFLTAARSRAFADLATARTIALTLLGREIPRNRVDSSTQLSRIQT